MNRGRRREKGEKGGERKGKGGEKKKGETTATEGFPWAIADRSLLFFSFL